MSAYVLDGRKGDEVEQLRGLFPRRFPLRGGGEVSVEVLPPPPPPPASAGDGDGGAAGKHTATTTTVPREQAERALMAMLNEEIDAGTYPQDRRLDDVESFRAYYCSHVVLVAVEVEQARGEESRGSGGGEAAVLGSVYIKPNFPGRCAHLCNGGFLVRRSQRRRGVGSALVAAFERAATALRYTAAFFNLVFVDNAASLALWRKFGYVKVGVVPGAKRLPRSEVDGDDAAVDGVDAIMLHKRLQ